MKSRNALPGIVLAIALSALSCASVEENRPTTLDTGSADFTRLVILGDSFAAGIQSGGLVLRNQRTSFAGLVARQAAAPDFEIPSVAEPGVPKLLAILSIAPPNIGVPPPADNSADWQGRFTNLTLPRPYNNLAIPGARTPQILSSNLTGDPHESAFYLYTPAILRPTGPQAVPALQQALALDPTFAIVELGINDVGSGIFNGDPGRITPYGEFVSAYDTIIDAFSELRQHGALSGAVVVNIPSLLVYPYLTTIPWFVTTPQGEPIDDGDGNLIPLIGVVNGTPQPLPPGSLVLLPAVSLLRQGYGLPPGIPGSNGQPLPADLILDNLPGGEVETAQAAIDRMNDHIAAVASSAGFALVDLNALLLDAAANGREVAGVRMTTDYITGGFFSLDGIHPSNLGHAFAANAVITAIDEKQGANIPLVELNEFLGIDFGVQRVGGYSGGVAAGEQLQDRVRNIFH